MAEDLYDLMPHSKIKELEAQIEDLKKGEPTSNVALKRNIDDLNKNIRSMMELFRIAAEEMKMEERQTTNVSVRVKSISEQMKDVLDQNQKIANGILALADIMHGEFPKVIQRLDMIGHKLERPVDIRKKSSMEIAKQFEGGFAPSKHSQSFGGMASSQTQSMGGTQMPPPPGGSISSPSPMPSFGTGMPIPPPPSNSPGIGMPPPPNLQDKKKFGLF